MTFEHYLNRYLNFSDKFDVKFYKKEFYFINYSFGMFRTLFNSKHSIYNLVKLFSYC